MMKIKNHPLFEGLNSLAGLQGWKCAIEPICAMHRRRVRRVRSSRLAPVFGSAGRLSPRADRSGLARACRPVVGQASIGPAAHRQNNHDQPTDFDRSLFTRRVVRAS